MNKSYIGLKFGTIKCWNFEETFYKENKKLIHEFNNFYNKLFEKCCDMFSASEKIKREETLKTELCNRLDTFFDLGCEIYNDFDGKTYKTKKSYRKYILNYGKEN